LSYLGTCVLRRLQPVIPTAPRSPRTRAARPAPTPPRTPQAHARTCPVAPQPCRVKAPAPHVSAPPAGAVSTVAPAVHLPPICQPNHRVDVAGARGVGCVILDLPDSVNTAIASFVNGLKDI